MRHGMAQNYGRGDMSFFLQLPDWLVEKIRVAASAILRRKGYSELTTLCGLTKADKLTPVIDRCYTLAETARAIAYVEEGHARAKVIITPQ